MSFLNPSADWERIAATNPLLAAAIACAPRPLFVPPPGVDPVMAYVRAVAFCVAVWVHVALLGMVLR